MIEKKGARPKKILCIAVVGLLAVFAGGQLVWKHHFQHYTPVDAQKAIEDLFNAGHIEGLYLIVGNQTNAQARAVVANVAQTIADYRREMTPEEKAGLGAFFRSDAGRSQIQEATACYQAKDVRFRSVTTPVIGELLATLAATH
jgi:hypothetical protein